MNQVFPYKSLAAMFLAQAQCTEDLRTDLIVLATRGRTGLKRFVIGNVAKKIVRYGPCPVLTVTPKAVA